MHRLATQLVVLVAHHQRAATIQLFAIRQPCRDTLADQHVRVNRHVWANHKFHPLDQRFTALPHAGVHVGAGGICGVDTKGTAAQPELIGREVLGVQHSQLAAALLRERERGGQACVGLQQLVGVYLFLT